jgi:IS5 family transposase
MRPIRKPVQCTLWEPWLDLPRAKELETISRLLDEYPTIYELTRQDLLAAGGAQGYPQGAKGLAADQVLRALILKQMYGWSYRDLAFHLGDSISCRNFCRIGMSDKLPSKSTLCRSMKALRSETLREIHLILLKAAVEMGVEESQTARIDCTAVETNIHHPTDSELLWDCVRKLTSLLKRARKILGKEIQFSNRTLRANRRRLKIAFARTAEARQQPYQDLLEVTQEVRSSAEAALPALHRRNDVGLVESLVLEEIGQQIRHFLPLTDQVLDQTRRRVVEGESVPAREKIVSIFEEHTDIIKKDRRDPVYGHKICLAAGRSLILDCKILEGNPADSTLAEEAIDRLTEIYDQPPEQVTFDGGFASKANLKAIKGKGVVDVVFAKKRGLAISAMARSKKIYKKLRNFRAGIEALISFLKRIFGLDRCTWKSLPSFHSYVWGSILAFNLLMIARHQLS